MNQQYISSNGQNKRNVEGGGRNHLGSSIVSGLRKSSRFLFLGKRSTSGSDRVNYGGIENDESHSLTGKTNRQPRSRNSRGHRKYSNKDRRSLMRKIALNNSISDFNDGDGVSLRDNLTVCSTRRNLNGNDNRDDNSSHNLNRNLNRSEFSTGANTVESMEPSVENYDRDTPYHLQDQLSSKKSSREMMYQSEAQADLSTAQEQVLTNVEYIFRQLLIIISSYLLGVFQPETLKQQVSVGVIQFTKVIAIAWATCLLIRALTWWCRVTADNNYRAIYTGERSVDGMDIENLTASQPLLKPSAIPMECFETESANYKNNNSSQSHGTSRSNSIEDGNPNHVTIPRVNSHPLPTVTSSPLSTIQKDKGGSTAAPVTAATSHIAADVNMDTAAYISSEKGQMGNRNILTNTARKNSADSAMTSKSGQQLSNEMDSPNSIHALKKMDLMTSSPLRNIFADLPLKSSTGSSVELNNISKDEILPPLKTNRFKTNDHQNHPELEDLSVLDSLTAKRLYPNGEPEPFENEYCVGLLLPMIRTSDADNNEKSKDLKGNASNDKVSNYFRMKQRRFEFQFQFKLKKQTKGDFYMVCELSKSLKLGIVQRAFIGATMNFVKKMNNGFHFNLTGDVVDEEAKKEGKYELPHMAFPVESSCDRIVVTKPGETVPQLGGEIYEDLDAVKARKKGGKMHFNTQDTYTLSIWSAYVDFCLWKCLNFPAIRPFSLSSVIGDQPFSLNMYSLISSERKQYHKCNLKTILSFEIGHTKKTFNSPAYNKWLQMRELPLINQSSNSTSKVGTVVGLEHSEHTRYLGEIEATDSEHDPDQIEVLEETADDDDNFETIEGLGEGIYLKSGDPIILREANPSDCDLFLNSGGGFAVLQQSQSTSRVIIEQTHLLNHSLSSTCSESAPPRARSKLIKNGDNVTFKLLLDDTKDVKYLTSHRGRWLKWVSYIPKSDGQFYIFTNEIEGDLELNEPGSDIPAIETPSSYVRLGGSFHLRSCGWSEHQVGVCMESSPKFGGRVIGLYKIGSSHVASIEDDLIDDEGEDLINDTSINTKGGKQWMKPLYLCTDLPADDDIILPNPGQHNASPLNEDILMYRIKNYSLDAPAWLEIMHRSKRERQRVYVMRMKINDSSVELATEVNERLKILNGNDNKRSVNETPRALIRLRTGSELKLILQLGVSLRSTTIPRGLQKWNSDSSKRLGSFEREYVKECSTQIDYSDNILENTKECEKDSLQVYSGEDKQLSQNLPNNTEFISSGDRCSDSYLDESASDNEVDDGVADSVSDDNEYDASIGVEVEQDPLDSDGSVIIDIPVESNLKPSSTKKKNWIQKSGISKVANTVVVKPGKFVTKVSRNAGRAIISKRRHKPPNMKLRFSRKTGRKKRKVNKTLKITGTPIDLNTENTGNLETKIIAGQLNVPDQSCRTVSHILSNMTSIYSQKPSLVSQKVLNLLNNTMCMRSELDSGFLKGSIVELGIIPAKQEKETVLAEYVVARCLWESHWREEACLLCESSIVFYEPLTKKPCFTVSYIDVQSIRKLDDNEKEVPLPGFPLIVIETVWRCYYIAFSDDESRGDFKKKINEAIFSHGSGETKMELDVWRAHLWQQGISSSLESSLSDGRGKWATVTSSNKTKERSVLNSRRMAFDCNEFITKDCPNLGKSISVFVENLLKKALSFSLESLESSPKAFSTFLDESSRLRLLPIRHFDRCGSETFCIWINLYHCLLQHALLLSRHGPPNKKSIVHFMRTSSYEIGGDVFSLAELECCVIRGNMSQAVHPRRPVVLAPKNSRAHLCHALGIIDPRVNFILNSSDLSKLQHVPVLKADILEEQLSLCTSSFLKKQFSIDLLRRLVTLPKVCDVYRNDFGNGDAQSCAYFCLQYLDTSKQDVFLEMINSSNDVIYKYQQSNDQFHLNLKEFTQQLK